MYFEVFEKSLERVGKCPGNSLNSIEYLAKKCVQKCTYANKTLYFTFCDMSSELY
jgi:hypothetical protein